VLILTDAEALERVSPDDVTTLTEAAIAATFYRDGLTPEQLGSNRRVIEISAPTCIAAASSPHQLFVAALVDDQFAGYVVSTEHAADNRELDWLMVHPRYHGSSVSAALMQAGMEWLGLDRPMWLNVISFNERAIRFYRRFGFEVDPDAMLDRPMPHLIMRRAPNESSA
jgi:ribosomal protein S18 acetylase RimI-like enzyme